MADAAKLESTWLRATRLLIPVGVVGLIALMVIPLHPTLLDLLISFSVSLAMVVLLTALYVKTPLNFSVFPSMLLLVTVFRLGLNIASTRRILLHGNEGTQAAGHVIEAFGQFVVGGNIIVGMVIFLVLLIVQFVVINHGANRISEVAARFTLDAMPGKQMAIDADLNAGLIDEIEARTRRRKIQDEADFYGAMDGAVKFTQRDAIASLIIVAINLLAGLAIGMVQGGMPALDALRTYSVLTVGDGLVSAIPALLISVAGALITTRSGTDEELATEVTKQVLSNPTPLAIASGFLGTMALIPGLPTAAFLTLSAGVGALAASQRRRIKRELEPTASDTPPGELLPEEPIEPLLTIDPLTIEVGYELVEMAGSEKRGGLLDRIRGIRRQTALDLGMVVPPVRVRDNLRLASDEYQILLRGSEVASNRIPRRRVLAIDPGDVLEPIEGEKTKDPAFGIEALWIDEGLADHARSVGYTVVDRTSVLATHLSETIRRHATELLGRQETQKLLDILGKAAPKLVEELVPERFSVGQIQKVLQALLRERVSIRDLQTICETLADAAGQNAEGSDLVGRVRQALGRSLVRPLMEKDSLNVVTLSSELEQQIRELSAPKQDAGLVPADPRVTQSLIHRVATAIRDLPSGCQPVILCGSNQSRSALRSLTETTLPTVPFLSVFEVPDGVRVNAVGQVR